MTKLSATYLLLAEVALASGAGAQPTPAPSASPRTAPAPAAADAKDEARAHFELGVSHFDRQEWPAALVEFLRSRELFGTKGNTKNAAICLRKVGRFDEALDMFEALLRDFPDVSPVERQLAQREIDELKASVGTVTLRGAPAGATVTIDGIDRGRTPIAAPIRLASGSHSVRVTEESFLPFEARLDLAGGQAAVVAVQLAQLTQAGRLHAVEHDGRALELVVDGAVVGRTPWDGALAPGPHTALMRGDGALGTPPVAVNVRINEVTTLDLVAEELRSVVRVEPAPAEAMVSVDGVPVGRGAWEGRLRAGSHQVAASLVGFQPLQRDVVLSPDGREIVHAILTPDPSLSGPTARIALELDAGLAVGLAGGGGDLATACTGGCSAGLPLGVHGVAHGTYLLGNGFGVGADVGYLLLADTITGRSTSLTSGTLAAQGAATDKVALGGLTVGVAGQYHTRSDWPLTFRFGVGVLLGSATDARTGTFTDPKAPAQPSTFTVSTQQSPAATYLYLAPEARVGRRFGDHFELSAGVVVLVMPAIKQPKWDATQPVPSGGDGEGVFPAQSLAGSVLVAAVPGVGARYEF